MEQNTRRGVIGIPPNPNKRGGPSPGCGSFKRDGEMAAEEYFGASGGLPTLPPGYFQNELPPSSVPKPRREGDSLITLRKLEPPENETLFEIHPDLNKIWEVPALQEHAKASFERWGVAEPDNEPSSGEIFTIDENGKPIGITGWFTYDETFSDVLRLRYHGIIAERRGRGLGEEAMRLLLEWLSKVAPPQYAWLAESVSLNRGDVALRVAEHFKNMGFVEFDDPKYGDNAGCGETLSLKVRIPGR